MLEYPYSIYKFQIKSYDSDQNGNLTLHALFHFLQECAWDNARLNNFGYEYLNSQNAFWVLSRVIVQMDKYPKWKDEIEIKTWPKGKDGFFALRDFEVYLNGKVIGKVASSWLILDQKSRRPRKLDDFNFVHENFIQESVLERKPDKIIFKGELTEKDNRKVYSSDLDVNKHVNNATYVRWILDSYYSDNRKLISEFEINFISELMLNDRFNVYSFMDGADTFYALKNEELKDICRASIK